LNKAQRKPRGARRLLARVPRPLLALAALGLLGLLLLGARTLWRAYKNRPLPVAVDPSFRLGYNLDFPGEWSHLVPFIDQMKSARAMVGGCPDEEPQCDTAAHLDLDDNGWVKSLRYKDDPTRSYRQIEIIFNTAEDRYDAGRRFFVTWRGQGTVVLSGALDAELVPGQRRLRFSMPNGTALVRLTSIDPQRTGDYLRDIRIFREDHEELLERGELFNPDMLSYLAPFKSVRFMDWMQSNSPGRCSGGPAHGQECYPEIRDTCGGGRCVMPGVWNERPRAERPSLLSWGQYLDDAAPGRGTRVGGYPVEVLVALANKLGADPHFNMPALFDEEYVRSFATLVKSQLRPDLVARVEYSNEVWNWDFPQAQYAGHQGKKLWPEDGTAWVQYFASRTDEMCRLWKEVFAGQEFRLRCLISPQTGWHDLAETALECPSWVKMRPELGSCYGHVDAINITGYFSGCLHQREAVLAEWLSEGREVALDRAFEQLNHGGKLDDCEDNLDRTIEGYQFFAQLALRRGLGLNVYEGGTHFEFNGRADVKKLLVEMTRDVRMKEAYLRNFEGLRLAGGSVFNLWGWIAKDDTWANAESLTDRKHAKYQAILEYTAAHPPAPRGTSR
jgi:hypothetical protein